MVETPVSFDRRDVFAAIGLAIVVLIAGYWYMVLGVCGNYHDDAIYVSTAKAIAEGKGYRLINLPTTPVQTKYPFLYPLVLAIIWKIWPSFPGNLFAMQWLTLMTGAATVALSYLYVLQFGYCTRRIAVASGLLCATSGGFLFYSTQTLSEIPFALLFVLSMWAIDKHIRNPFESRCSQFFIGILLALPFLCRTVGLALPVVGLIVVCRLRRPVVWLALGSLAGMFPWVLWVVTGIGGGADHSMAIYYTDYGGWWYRFGLPSVFRVFFLNLLMVGFHGTSLGLGGLQREVLYVGFEIWLIFGMLVCYATVIGASRQLRRVRLLPWCLIGYMSIVLLWPWKPYRFLVPVLPLLLVYALTGIREMVRRLSSLSIYRTLLVFGLTVAVTANTLWLYRDGQLRRSTGYVSTRDTYDDRSLYWSSFENVFEWLKKHSQPSDLIASPLDSMIYLYTGRRAFRPYVANPIAVFYLLDRPPVGTREDFIRALEVFRPKYLAQIPVPGSAAERAFAEFLDRFVATQPGWLRPVHIGDDPRFVIYEVQLQTEASSR